MTHQGKIGILPEAIREELNQRLLDGEPGSKILPWLNGLPVVNRLLAENAEGLRVTDQNLSNWRNKGFAEWKRRREQLSRVKTMAEYSVKLAEANGGNMTKGAAAMLSGRILEVLESLDEILAKPDDDTPAEPMTAEKLTALAETITSLTEALASLRVGDQNDQRLKQYDERTRLLESRLKQMEQSLALAKQKFQRDTCVLFLKWVDDQKVREILAGADNTDAKTQRLGELIFGEDWK